MTFIIEGIPPDLFPNPLNPNSMIGLFDSYCPTCCQTVFTSLDFLCLECGTPTITDSVFKAAGLDPNPRIPEGKALYPDLDGKALVGLTIKQPFADYIGYGKVEARTWQTKYRGLVLIASAAKPYTAKELADPRIITLRVPRGYPDPTELPGHNGSALYLARLADVRPLTPDDESFMRWAPGMSKWFGFHFEDVIPLHPVPVKGAQMLWPVADKVRRSLRSESY